MPREMVTRKSVRPRRKLPHMLSTRCCARCVALCGPFGCRSWPPPREVCEPSCKERLSARSCCSNVATMGGEGCKKRCTYPCPIRWCGRNGHCTLRLVYLAPSPTWHQGHIGQHVWPRKKLLRLLTLETRVRNDWSCSLHANMVRKKTATSRATNPHKRRGNVGKLKNHKHASTRNVVLKPSEGWAYSPHNSRPDPSSPSPPPQCAMRDRAWHRVVRTSLTVQPLRRILKRKWQFWPNRGVSRFASLLRTSLQSFDGFRRHSRCIAIHPHTVPTAPDAHDCFPVVE